MNRFLYFLILVFVLLAITESISSDPARKYISEYKDIAINEMHRTGIPASIKLAQALIESDWGRSDLAVKANNHFGIKCGGKWSGQTFLKKDDDYDQEGKLLESCFRVYSHAQESYKNHSEFLTDPSKSARYGFLFNYKTTDYTSWAYGLQTAGYASDQKYPKKIIGVIEKYKLHEFDKEIKPAQSNDIVEAPSTKKDNDLNKKLPASVRSKISYSIRNTIVHADMSAKDLAELNNMSIRDFLSYNEIVLLPGDIIKKGTTIFLEQKKRDYEGAEESYILKDGETIETVAHMYGVRARTLKAINKIKKGEALQPGTSVKLRK